MLIQLQLYHVYVMFHRISAVNTSFLSLLSVNVDVAAESVMFYGYFVYFC